MANRSDADKPGDGYETDTDWIIGRPGFDGQSFTGWTFDTLDKAAPETIWSIEDEMIIVKGKDNPAGVMRTDKSYSNYTLEFEWRWMDSGGNSGCLIHCSEPRLKNVWPKSIEVQLMAEQAARRMEQDADCYHRQYRRGLCEQHACAERLECLNFRRCHLPSGPGYG